MPRTARADQPSRGTITRTIHDVYAGPAWHGPAVLATLRGVTAPVARRRIAPARNTIWELVLHLAYGRHRLLGRLGVETGKFPRRLAKAWWPLMPEDASEAAWRADLALLSDYESRLLVAVEQASDAALRRVRPGQKRSIAHELLGIAIHDAYHAGQIRILRP